MQSFHRPVRLDPRIETAELWQDFHAAFVGNLRDILRRTLPNNYVALMEERVYLAWEGTLPGSAYRPDVSITRTPSSLGPFHAREPGTGGLAQPIIVAVAIRDEVRERRVVIRTAAGELVTVIELLSPNNKRPGHEGRTAYLSKRKELLEAGIHLVEVDLLQGGQRVPLAQPWPPCERSVLVVRSQRLHAAELYPFGISDPLPTVRLPLRAPDPDHPLDLQAVLEETWERGRYDELLARLGIGGA